MFTREGGCLVWVPVFAGTHVLVWDTLTPRDTTPAPAGVDGRTIVHLPLKTQRSP